MPDITCCKGKGCQQKEDCYRYTSFDPSEIMQTYFEKEPWNENHCDYFSPNNKH